MTRENIVDRLLNFIHRTWRWIVNEHPSDAYKITLPRPAEEGRNKLTDYFRLVEAAYEARAIKWEGDGDRLSITFTVSARDQASPRQREAFALGKSMMV